MSMKRIVLILSACCSGLASAAVDGQRQTWQAEPVDNIWSITAPNWDMGAVWGQSNQAVFADSTVKTIMLPGTTYVETISFEVDGYTLTGPGPILSERIGMEEGSGLVDLHVSVAEGLSAEVAVPMENGDQGRFFKCGLGTLTLTGNNYFYRTSVSNGVLRLVNSTLTTAKIQNYALNRNSPNVRIHFDGATLMPYNNNVLLGERMYHFYEATVGAGGLIFATSPRHPAVKNVRLDHALKPAADVPESGDGGITMAGTYNFYIDSPTCDLTGGFTLLDGVAYLNKPTGLGTGPFALHAPFYVTNSMALANEIVCHDGAVVGLANAAETLTLQNLSLSDTHGDGRIVFESKNGGGEIRHVSPGTQRVGGYHLKGGVSLVADGDTYAARNDAQGSLIAADDASSRLIVCTGGVVVDTNGRDLSLDAEMVFRGSVTTNFSADTFFENGSFEENKGKGWTFGNGTAGASSVKENGSAFDNPDRQTTDGTKYAVIRSGGGFAERTFTVPESGKWAIVFDYANRPGYDPESKLAWEVRLDSEPLREMAPDNLGDHGFITYESPYVELVANQTYTFKFMTGKPVVETSYDAILLDAVRLRKRTDTVDPLGTVTKKGAGTLHTAFLNAPGDVYVQEGTLATDGLFVSNVYVSAGATIAFSSSVTGLVPNASFEASATEGGFSYSTPSKWSSEKIPPQDNVAGWQANGSTITLNGPLTPYGIATAYLRPFTVLSTTFTVAEEGLYTIGFVHSTRKGEIDANGAGFLMNVDVRVDGENVYTLASRPEGGYDFLAQSVNVYLTAGEHTLAFKADDGNGQIEKMAGPMVLLDNVYVRKHVKAENYVAGTWHFEPGAVVDVGMNDVVLENVYVDGQRVSGGIYTMHQAGVTVLGTGTFRAGKQAGLIFTVR